MATLEQTLPLLNLESGAISTLIKPGDPISRMVSLPVWSPNSRRLAFTVTAPSPKSTSSPLRVAIFDVSSNRTTVVAEIAAPAMLVQPFGWASDHVLLVNNLGGEPMEQAVYSIRDDGTHALKVAWRRFLTTVL